MNIQRHYEMPEDDGMEADEALWFVKRSAEDQLRVDRWVNLGCAAIIAAVILWAVYG